MAPWFSKIRDALLAGAAEAGMPTFADGVAFPEVVDRLTGPV